MIAPTNNVTRMLAAKGVAFESHQLPNEKLGGIEAAAYLGVDPNQVYKTIVAIPDSGKPVLALAPATAQVSVKALGRALNARKVKLASHAQAEALTGLQAGGISPLALIGQGFRVVIDESANRQDKVYISGGQRGLNISLSPADLIGLTQARLASIAVD